MSNENVANFFDQALSLTDLSKQMLDRLFGPGWDSLRVTSDLEGAGSEVASLFFMMLGKVNLIMLSIIVAYIAYVSILETMSTASEGKVGQKHDLMWTPIRLGFAVFMTAPLTKIGLSLGQVLLLTMVGGSVTFANNLWSNCLEFFEKTGMTAIVAEPPESLLRTELQAATGMFIFNGVSFEYNMLAFKEYMPPESNSYGIKYSHNSEKKEWIVTFVVPEVMQGRSGIDNPALYGQISISGAANDNIAKARAKGLCDAFTAMRPAYFDIASQIKPSSDFIIKAQHAYSAAVMPELKSISEVYSDASIIKKIKEFRKEGELYGWMSAGAYTMKVARLQAEANAQLFQSPNITQPNINRIIKYTDDPFYSAFSGDIMSIMQRAYEDAEKAQDFKDPSSFMDWVGQVLSLRLAVTKIVKHFSNHDPFVSLAYLGQTAVATATTLYTAGLMATMGAAVVQTTTTEASNSLAGKVASVFSLGGTGILASVVAGAAAGFLAGMEYLAPLLYLVCLLLLVAGFFAAYALPALPFFYWIFAVMEWVLLIVEALVALPFWMLGHSISKQPGFAGESGKQGYILLLEVLIRPALLIIGLGFGFLAMSAIGKTIGKLIMIFADATYYDQGGVVATMAAPVTSIFLIVMIVLIYWKVMHMFFTRGVSHLPQTVTKWIGGGSSMTSQAEQQAGDSHRTLVAATGRVESRAMTAAGRKTAKAAKDAADGKKDSGDHIPGQTGAPPTSDGGGGQF